MRIIYLANVDWFFESHFLHLALRARARGFDVALASHIERSGPRLRASGIELIELPTRRGKLAPAGLYEAISIVARELKRDPTALLHAFGLFGITVGGWAGRRRQVNRSIYTITGLGYTAAAATAKARLVRVGVRHACAGVADGPGVRWLAENTEDIAACGLMSAAAEDRTAIVGGAGVDPQRFKPVPLPPAPPLKVALVARMIWSKGVDIAVEAVRQARARGVPVELTLAGGLDPGNPRGFSEANLRQFEQEGGVRWIGRVDDIDALWAAHHLALLPSRGGEGLPKALIEAAACGRPVLTTDVPGCRAFAQDTGGWSVPSGSPQALADALCRIAGAGDLQRRGDQARDVVLDRYTEEHNWQIVEQFYDELAAWRG